MPATDSTTGPAPHAQVGRYVMIKELGAGGMGAVYAAYDPDLDRKVALKLLKRKPHGDEELARARLLREAQAMARVSHQNVIPVFDVGLWGDQVFLAMELIDGDTLEGWLKRAQRSWREVVEVFIAAGQGLVAAHQAGLVHRDFKPSNVMVGRNGRVCVTDFGIARQLGAPAEGAAAPAPEADPSERRMLDKSLTQPGLAIGTPRFMSPEQLRGGEVDARSDQFSFCVSLYWALYGQHPFVEADLLDAAATQSTVSATETLASRRAVRNLPLPEPPRDRQVPAWVRQVLVRGLAVESQARFPTMAVLLEALSQERRRAKARRRTAIAAAAVASAGLVGGVAYQQSFACAGAARAMDEVWNPAARQRVEASLGERGGAFGKDAARRASEVLARYAEAWTRQRTEVCETARHPGSQTEELLSRRLGCLERRRRDLRAVVAMLAEADAKLAEKAVDAAHALPSLQECADLEALAEQPRLPEDPARRAELERLGGLLAEVKALADGGRIRPALEKAGQMESAVAAAGYAPLTAEWRFRRGAAEDQVGDSEAARRDLLQASMDAEAGHADRLMVAALAKLLFVEGKLGRFDRADDWGGLAEAALRRIGGGEPELEADLRVSQGVMETTRRRFDQAQGWLERAQSLQAALPPGHPKRARIAFLLGNVLLQRGERARAAELLEIALEQTQAAVGPLHPDMARRHLLVAVVMRELGKPEQALEHARAAVDIRSQVLGKETEPTAESMDELGQCLLALKRYAEALEVYQAGLAIKQKALPPGDEQLQYTYDGVGQALLGLGRVKEAVVPLRQAVAITAAPPDVLAESGFALARALWEAGDHAGALAEAEKAQARFVEAKEEARAAEVTSWRAKVGKP